MDAREYELMATVEDGMWWYRAARALLLDALAAEAPAGRLLDAGCGTGGLLALLARAAPARERVGLDIAPRALAYARDKAAVAVVSASVNQLPFADGSFSAIVSVDVLCHAAVDQGAALAEMTRCLSRRGRLILNLPAYGWLRSAHDARVHNARRYVRGEVGRLLAGAGLVPRRLTYWNAVLFPAMVLHRKLPAGGTRKESDVKDYPWIIDRLFGLLLAAERRLIGLGLDLPFGGSILAVAEKP